MYKIGYIDEDDGWLNTFYQTFKMDFDILQVKVDSDSTVESITQVLFDESIDAIVTDYLLEEDANVSFNGNILVEAIRNDRPHFPIVMLTSHEPQAISHMDDVHIIYSKSILDGESEEELSLFKSKIKSSIDNYYTKKENSIRRIEELVTKRNMEGLKLTEEEELSKLYILFDEFEPEGKGLPVNLMQKGSITKLNEFVQEAKKILEELKKKTNK